MYGYPITPHTSPLPLSLPLNTMPSPSPAAASEATPSRTPPREVVGAHTIARLVDPGSPAPDLGAGTALFGRDYDAAGGAVSVLARVVANADGAAVKRLRSPSKVGGPPSPSKTPRAKRSNLGRAPPSPLRSSPVRVVAAAAAATFAPPPAAVRQNRSSPTSVLDDVFVVRSMTKPKGSKGAKGKKGASANAKTSKMKMVGLAPSSAFLRWARPRIFGKP